MFIILLFRFLLRLNKLFLIIFQLVYNIFLLIFVKINHIAFILLNSLYSFTEFWWTLIISIALLRSFPSIAQLSSFQNTQNFSSHETNSTHHNINQIPIQNHHTFLSAFQINDIFHASIHHIFLKLLLLL